MYCGAKTLQVGVLLLLLLLPLCALHAALVPVSPIQPSPLPALLPQHIMPRFYPPALGPLEGVPRTGPAPVLARPWEWERVVARWEGLASQIEADEEAREALGWPREMFAFALAAAVERLDLELAVSAESTCCLLRLACTTVGCPCVTCVPPPSPPRACSTRPTAA